MNARTKLSLYKYGMWFASTALPLLAVAAEGMHGLIAGPFIALALRQFDKDVVEPLEDELEAEEAADTDTDDGSGDPGSETIAVEPAPTAAEA